jgi:hypothetical protein
VTSRPAARRRMGKCHVSRGDGLRRGRLRAVVSYWHERGEKELKSNDSEWAEIHSFFRCRACVTGGQTERLEVGLTRSGVRVQCKKHGLVVHVTPESLLEMIARGPQCDCCPGGMHRS